MEPQNSHISFLNSTYNKSANITTINSNKQPYEREKIIKQILIF